MPQIEKTTKNKEAVAMLEGKCYCCGKGGHYCVVSKIHIQKKNGQSTKPRQKKDLNNNHT
jgi:hypothetical protein